MASLGTLAAELKLEGAAGMMSGLRDVGGAVSSLGNVLGGVRAPLAQLDGAMRTVQASGAGISAAVTPVQSAVAMIGRLPGQASRAARALQTLSRAGAGALGAFARSRVSSNFAAAAERLPETGRMTRSVVDVSRRIGETPRLNLGARPRLTETRAGTPVAGGADFARGLRSTLEHFRAGLRGGNPVAGAERRTPGGSDSAAASLAALVGQLRGAAVRGGSSTANTGGNMGAEAGRGADGDRLARIGGFIGGGGGPALDFHRRTAAATEKTAAGIQSLLQRLPAVEKPLTALWA